MVFSPDWAIQRCPLMSPSLMEKGAQKASALAAAGTTESQREDEGGKEKNGLEICVRSRWTPRSSPKAWTARFCHLLPWQKMRGLFSEQVKQRSSGSRNTWHSYEQDWDSAQNTGVLDKSLPNEWWTPHLHLAQANSQESGKQAYSPKAGN